MASKQIISYGAKVERSTNGVSYTVIPECKGIAVPEVEQEYPEVTSMDSPDGYREYIKGLKDAGEIEVPCGYTSDGFARMIADQNANNPIYYRVTLKQAPGQNVIGDRFTFRGFPTPRLAPGELGEPINMTLVIRVTGDFTWVAGS